MTTHHFVTSWHWNVWQITLTKLYLFLGQRCSIWGTFVASKITTENTFGSWNQSATTVSAFPGNPGQDTVGNRGVVQSRILYQLLLEDIANIISYYTWLHCTVRLVARCHGPSYVHVGRCHANHCSLYIRLPPTSKYSVVGPVDGSQSVRVGARSLRRALRPSLLWWLRRLQRTRRTVRMLSSPVDARGRLWYILSISADQFGAVRCSSLDLDLLHVQVDLSRGQSIQEEAGNDEVFPRAAWSHSVSCSSCGCLCDLSDHDPNPTHLGRDRANYREEMPHGFLLLQIRCQQRTRC